MERSGAGTGHRALNSAPTTGTMHHILCLEEMVKSGAAPGWHALCLGTVFLRLGLSPVRGRAGALAGGLRLSHKQLWSSPPPAPHVPVLREIQERPFLTFVETQTRFACVRV